MDERLPDQTNRRPSCHRVAWYVRRTTTPSRGTSSWISSQPGPGSSSRAWDQSMRPADRQGLPLCLQRAQRAGHRRGQRLHDTHGTRAVLAEAAEPSTEPALAPGHRRLRLSRRAGTASGSRCRADSYLATQSTEQTCPSSLKPPSATCRCPTVLACDVRVLGAVALEPTAGSGRDRCPGTEAAAAAGGSRGPRQRRGVGRRPGGGGVG